MSSRNKKRLVPGAEQALEKLKMEIASELGLVGGSADTTWESVPSAVCGSIGGHIGGNMVRRMIEIAEKQMAAKQ